MFTRYAPLVRRLGLQLVAKMPASVDLDDLIQAGMIGLMDGASRYKEDQGAQFEIYASQRIRGVMLDELCANDWLPRSMRKTSREVESAVHKVEQNLGRSASEAEIAEHMNLPLDEYQSMLQDLHGSQLIYSLGGRRAVPRPLLRRSFGPAVGGARRQPARRADRSHQSAR